MTRPIMSAPFNVSVRYPGPVYRALRRAFDDVDSLYQTRTLELADPAVVIDTERRSVRLCYVHFGRVILKVDVANALVGLGLRSAVYAETYACGVGRANDQREFPIIGFGSRIKVNRGWLVPCLGMVRRRAEGKCKGGWVRSISFVNAGNEFYPRARFLAAFLEQP